MSDDERISFIDGLDSDQEDGASDDLDSEPPQENLDDVSENDSENGSESEPEAEMAVKKRRKIVKNMFIDDEAELSGDDAVSEDEDDKSDDESVDLGLVDKEAQELDSDQEEEVRGLYHKQLEKEDKRAVLLMQEHLEEKEVGIGQRRRRKFRWQTKELMENSLRRHYDPDDDDSQGAEDDDDDIDYDDLKPMRLKRPTAESVLTESLRLSSRSGVPSILDDDSSSNNPVERIKSTSMNVAMTHGSSSNTNQDLSRFVFRDKDIVQALSTRETSIITREERDRNIQRELKKVIQSKSIFDQLYS